MHPPRLFPLRALACAPYPVPLTVRSSVWVVAALHQPIGVLLGEPDLYLKRDVG